MATIPKRISHKDHSHPSTKHYTKLCRDQIIAGGGPLDITFTGSTGLPETVSGSDGGTTVMDEPKTKPKSMSLDDLHELWLNLEIAKGLLDKMGLKATYNGTGWTLRH